jgi:hypothetical protein
LVDLAHAANVRVEVPFKQEIGHRGLGMDWHGPARAHGGPHRRHQPGRHHRIGHAQAGRQNLGKGAEIGHAALLIQALQTGQRPPGIVEFAVVIVLHHQRAASRGTVEQREAARQAHGYAGGILMMG